MPNFQKNIFHFIKTAHLYATGNPAEYKRAVYMLFQYEILTVLKIFQEPLDCK